MVRKTTKYFKKEIVKFTRELHRLFVIIITYPLVKWDLDTARDFLAEIERMRMRLTAIKKELEPHPRIRMAVFTEDDWKDIPFFFLEWRTYGGIERGRWYTKHPFIDYTIEEVLEILQSCIVRLREIVGEKVVRTIKVAFFRPYAKPDFVFIINQMWNYKVRVVTPLDWSIGTLRGVPALQLPISEMFVGITPAMAIRGYEYSVKHYACIMLSVGEIINLHELENIRTRHTSDYENLKISVTGVVPKDGRVWVYDYINRIAVREIRVTEKNRIFEVDFSGYSNIIEVGSEFDDWEFRDFIRNLQRYGEIVIEEELISLLELL